MGIKRPLNRKQLIEQHVASMREFARELDSGLPLVSRRKVTRRIRKCADEIARVHEIINAREKAVDG